MTARTRTGKLPGRPRPPLQPAPLPVYVRPRDSKLVFGISRATLYRWADRGAITIFRRGSASFVSVAEVSAYIEGLAD